GAAVPPARTRVVDPPGVAHPWPPRYAVPRNASSARRRAQCDEDDSGKTMTTHDRSLEKGPAGKRASVSIGRAAPRQLTTPRTDFPATGRTTGASKGELLEL